MTSDQRRRLDPSDPDADLDRFSSDELEDTAFGPDPERRRAERAAGRQTEREARRARAEVRPTKFCHACATTLDARAEICPSCGVRQAGMSGRRSTRDRTTAAVLALVALFAGGVMIDRFYLGRTGAGILSVLFFWTGIPWVLSLVHLIQFLTMTDERFDETYG